MRRRLILFIILISLFSAQAMAIDAVAEIKGKHIVENDTDLKTGQHTFVLSAVGSSPMPEGSVGGKKSVTVSSNEPFSFGEIRYTADGTYNYTVTRVLVQSDRLEEDDSKYNVSVVVTNSVPAVIFQKEGTDAKADRIEFDDDYCCFLTFDLNGGTLRGDNGIITRKYKLGETITLPEAPAKEGYKFLYWKGSKYYAGQEYRVSEDHSFEAIYEKDDGSSDDKDKDDNSKDDKSNKDDNSGKDKSNKDKNDSSGRTDAKTGDAQQLSFYIGMFLAAAYAIVALKKKRQ